MRVAIVLGVAKYSNLDNLESVTNDVAAMSALLKATGRYPGILELAGELPAEPTKRKIIEYLSDFKAKDVDEVFFYFSGHGSRIEERLVFPMSDWSPDKQRSNSIQNDELDRWLKGLNPRLAVKVIDCCYSGIPYIKGESEIKSLVLPAEGIFRDCYFFLSSRFDQVSSAGQGENALSLYTRKFMDALLSLDNGEIRYQQLVDRISDLLNGDDQEPQFVTQGNARHVFCDLNAELRAALNSLSSPAPDAPELPPEPEEEERTEDQIFAAVQRDAEQCITRPEAEAVLAEIKGRLENAAANQPIEALYELSVRFPSWMDDDVAGAEQIGKWFKGKGKRFFGRATETEPMPRSIASPELSYPRGPSITGFVTDTHLEYDRILASAEPKFPNLNKWEFAALILWSERIAAVFTYSVEIRPTSWGHFDLPDVAPWGQRFFSRSDLGQIAPFVEKLLSGFWKTVQTSIKERFS